MKAPTPSSEGVVRLRYETIRNLTSPEEKSNGARSYFANVPVSEILKLDTAQNLRGYIPEHPGKKRSQTHMAIGTTLRDHSDRFIQLSSGITVSAAEIAVDDEKKVVTVTHGSIINGAQTQGEIRILLGELGEAVETVDFHARVEFLVDPDSEFVVQTAIARNTSTNIQRLSMAGKKKSLDDLNDAFQKVYPDLELSKSETDTGDKYVDTMRLLQVLWALMPDELMTMGQIKRKSGTEARLKSYKNRAYCLLDFEADVSAAAAAEPDEGAKARHKYFVDMAGRGWKEYLKWRHHERWSGKYLKVSTRAVRRNDDGLTVADGVIFPILAAMSHFVTPHTTSGRWHLTIPEIFDDGEMIDAARDQLSAHDGNPMLMGRDVAVYDALALLPKMVIRLNSRMMAA